MTDQQHEPDEAATMPTEDLRKMLAAAYGIPTDRLLADDEGSTRAAAAPDADIKLAVLRPRQQPDEAYRDALIDVWAHEKPSEQCCGPGDRHADRPDPLERARILSRLDIGPWRVPSWGLLEYDPVHDEWRIEVFPAGSTWANGDRALTKIIRRYAGRRLPGRPWVDLSPYIADEGVRAWFRPAGDMPPVPNARDLGYAHGGEGRALADRVSDAIDAAAPAVRRITEQTRATSTYLRDALDPVRQEMRRRGLDVIPPADLPTLAEALEGEAPGPTEITSGPAGPLAADLLIIDDPHTVAEAAAGIRVADRVDAAAPPPIGDQLAAAAGGTYVYCTPTMPAPSDPFVAGIEDAIRHQAMRRGRA